VLRLLLLLLLLVLLLGCSGKSNNTTQAKPPELPAILQFEESRRSMRRRSKSRIRSLIGGTYMYTKSTTQRYGPGSNYGYVCGGWSGGSRLSTIDRFQFPFNSGTANQVGNLSGSRGWLSSNNSSTHGYVCGGWDGNYLTTIDRFQFPFNSGTASHVGNLSGSRDNSSANNSSIHGYVCGGYSFDNNSWYSTIDRFQFPFDSSTVSQVGNLSGSKRELSANNSSTYGYVCGGYADLSCFSTIDRFQFPFSDGTANHVGNLSGSRFYLSANNSSTHGYICGGSSGNGLSIIDRFQFPFDSGTANQVSNLSVYRSNSGANNSSTHGYVCGGFKGGYQILDVYSTIDRFQFPFDSGTVSQVGNLSGSRRSLSATDGVDFVTMFV